MISERANEMYKYLYMDFIDDAKAFDKVKHEEIMEDLATLEIDGKGIRLLRPLYWEQTAVIYLEGYISNWINIKGGVRQDCVLSPDAFLLYAEIIIRRMMFNGSFRITSKIISNIRYVYDTVLIIDNKESLRVESEIVFIDRY